MPAVMAMDERLHYVIGYHPKYLGSHSINADEKDIIYHHLQSDACVAMGNEMMVS